MATFLDPRFKSLSFLPEEGRKEITTDIELELSEMLAEFTSSSDSTTQEPPRRKTKGRIQVTDDVINPSQENQTAATSRERAKSEVSKYIGEGSVKEKPLQWWNLNSHRYPGLSHLARKYLCIPATSVPLERAFSRAGHIINRKRACLLPDTVQMLVFLAENLD